MTQARSKRKSGKAAPLSRSEIMSRIRGRDTAPEIVVRKIIHALGFRFRLQRRDLPGTPDVVLPRHRTAIFVHGCFWHRHPGCSRATTPKTNGDFWHAKFDRNVERDRAAVQALQAVGWRVEVVWECETRDRSRLVKRLSNMFGPHERPAA